MKEPIRLLESNDIEEGAVVRLRNDNEFSPLIRELAENFSQNNSASGEEIDDDMKKLLGDDFG